MILQTYYECQMFFFNAMKGWTIKNMDEVVQDYLIEMESIAENQDNIGALDDILYEIEHPKNSLI